MKEIVCAGHVNWDVTLYVDTLPEADGEAAIVEQTQAGGGSASNTAAVLAELDLQPLLLGSVGDDEYAPLVRKELTDVGVDCTYLQYVDGGDTTVKYLIVDETGEVMVLANEGVNEAFSVADLPDETLADAAHLHLTSQQPGTARSLAQTARDFGVTVSVDPGRRIDQRDYRAVVDIADVVFLNDREASAAREDGILAGHDGITVIKRGDVGAEARTNDRTVRHAGFDVDPVDTAGAGDAFAAGFLASWVDGESVETAIAIGNACGAIAASSFGARTSLSWDDVDGYLRKRGYTGRRNDR